MRQILLLILVGAAGYARAYYFVQPGRSLSHFERRAIELLSDDDLAVREEATMASSPSSSLLEMEQVSVGNLVEDLKTRGVFRLDGLLDASQTQHLLSLINKQLKVSKDAVSDLSFENPYFSQSKSQENRWDVKLPLTEGLRTTLECLLGRGTLLGDTLERVAGPKARIHELAAFITINGAKRQVMHSDSPWSALPSLFTCTLACQDVDAQMGPTVFIPTTHTEEAQLVRMEEFMEDDIDSKDSALLSLPHELSLLSCGSAALYDSRLLHCGGANRAVPLRPRVLFYFTVASQAADEGAEEDELFDPQGDLQDRGSKGASLREENRGLTLADFRL